MKKLNVKLMNPKKNTEQELDNMARQIASALVNSEVFVETCKGGKDE